ncbi:hypothetical protein PYCCODRAFT_1428893 [Trametes coccinea BRFM310]|uniref:Uncharacterized protein n=1 Tax=Trametes coccinea (strain BRFM310) TaxID=1353009 RepID=A0A1Y2I6L0_TRAC3|nr:hypothetical protein PYCCODRAFT_1428893 [Trametes coccinea BRFM310]
MVALRTGEYLPLADDSSECRTDIAAGENLATKREAPASMPTWEARQMVAPRLVRVEEDLSPTLQRIPYGKDKAWCEAGPVSSFRGIPYRRRILGGTFAKSLRQNSSMLTLSRPTQIVVISNPLTSRMILQVECEPSYASPNDNSSPRDVLVLLLPK